MSQKFGLDWRKYEARRMLGFMVAIAEEAKSQKEHLTKSYGRRNGKI